jgi:hypothetical protein
MSNLRIVYDNAISRVAPGNLTASSTASTFAVTNLQSDKKSNVWRAVGELERITATWSAAETIGAVALPFCNLSPTATMRVRLTNEPSVTNLFVYTEQLASGWTAANVTFTSMNNAAPSGALTACLLTGSGTAASTLTQAKSMTAGSTYPVSCFVKAGTFTGNFTVTDTTEAGSLSFNLTSKAVSASGIFSGAVATLIGNGWYRISALAKPVVTTGSHTFSLWNATTTGNMLVWGAMLASGAAVLTSYYPSGASAGVRPLGYIDSWQSYDYDSMAAACPALSLRPRGWTAIQAASAYAYGGGAYARHWLPAAQQAVGLAVDISDPDNLQGYIEAACFVAGPVWSPTYNAVSAHLTTVDSTDLYLTDAGDQGADAGPARDRISVELGVLPSADRTAYASIMRNSRAYPVLLSVFTGVADLERERDYMVYGRRTKDAEIATTYAGMYSTTDEIEEI